MSMMKGSYKNDDDQNDLHKKDEALKE